MRWAVLLVADIGNSNISLGVYDRDVLAATWRIASDQHKTSDEYALLLRSLLQFEGFAPGAITNAVIGSVVPPLVRTLVDACVRCGIASPLVVGAGVRTGMKISYEHPKDVGADRIANAVGAMRTYGVPAVVVDLGTATTIDAISHNGEYVGGAIAPGMGISSEALFEHASKLPRVELTRPKTAIGRSTVAAMQSGIVFGYAGLVDGIVGRIQAELGGRARVIATGGLAEIVAKESSTIELVNQHLTLLGLWHIHQLNRVSP